MFGFPGVRGFATTPRLMAEIPVGISPKPAKQETWFDLVRNFRKRFRNETGSVLSVRAFRSKRRERRAQAASV